LKHELKKKPISLNIPVINLIIKINLVFILYFKIEYFDSGIDICFIKIKFTLPFHSRRTEK
jgi:hypothetical protein